MASHQTATPATGDNNPTTSTTCDVCSKPALFMCSLCGANQSPASTATVPRFYCSVECQRIDWPVHKTCCEGSVRIQQERLQQQQLKEQQQNPPDSSETLSNNPQIHQQSQSQQQRQTLPTLNAPAPSTHGSSNMTTSSNAARRFTGENDPTEQERIMDMRFYMKQIYTIIKPVMCCIILSVLWVKLSNPVDSIFDTGVPITVPSSVSVGQVFGSSGNGTQDTSSLMTALIILSQIIVATIIIMCLFRYGQIKIIYGIFVFVVMLLLGYFGYMLGTTLLFVAALPLDYISFAFFLWNLVAVGLAVIFWKGPLFIQQGYLILMSSMMAFSLSQLPDLVTWILLGLLAIWDLIAVLCPFGPLRLLLESAQTQDQQLPAALLYSAMVFMAAPGNHPSSRVSPAVDQKSEFTQLRHIASLPLATEHPTAGYNARDETPDNNAGTYYLSTTDQLEERPLQADLSSRGIELETMGDIRQNHPGINTSNHDNYEIPPVVDDTDDDEDSGLKLGLGDFVFYSVLVGRASLFDWITTMSTIVAVTAGLSMTIFFLAVYRKPLPALPFSIAFGILFYFLSAITLTPFLDHFVIRPPIIIPPTVGSSLWVGKSVGGGMIYL
ncbi:hypothetical protein O5D80_002000 [Batrachochytrium dendrobatidis]|nr:hypothetical protein O5D80_002000 [Batrachochytrium dendrobatidis]